MADSQHKADSNFGANTRPEQPRITGTEVIAIVLSLGWLAAAGLFFLMLPADATQEGGEGVDSLRFVMTLLAVFLPVAMIWVAAAAARSARIVREESRRLQVAIDAMRKTYVADRQARGSGVSRNDSVERKLNEIARSAQKTETALATFATSRAAVAAASKGPVSAAPTEAGAEDQPALALGTSVEDTLPPLAKPLLIRALNFPDTDKDEEGFSALRQALRDRKAKQLIQASQDILTLLSQDGIYMDDMRPDRARPEVWRQFANGIRGRAVAALGGIRDRSSLALAAGRMREDTIFRDAAHHFLRKFDQMLVEFEGTATDQEIDELSKTRTARAFMLLGRVTGAFD